MFLHQMFLNADENQKSNLFVICAAQIELFSWNTIDSNLALMCC